MLLTATIAWSNSFVIPTAPAQHDGDSPKLATSITDGNVTLNWSLQQTGKATPTGYRIFRRLPARDPEGQYETIVADTGSTTTVFVDHCANQAGTTYQYQVAVLHDGNTSPRSNPSQIALKSDHQAPNPSSCSATIVGPYIVPDGVRIFDAYGDTQETPTKHTADDTYGHGELIVVAVEFNEPVDTSAATLKLNIGPHVETLTPVDQDGNVAYFATTVADEHIDNDGVHIGDYTETFGHNPTGAIYSKATSRRTNLYHPALGTLANHKVKGYAQRPRITEVRILPPAHPDHGYLRGETIHIQVHFSQPVVVTDPVHATLRMGADATATPRTAAYERGTTTATLGFSYLVTDADQDADGITVSIHDQGHIVGKTAGLLSDMSNHPAPLEESLKVNGNLVNVPEVMAEAAWNWQSQSPGSDTVEIDFTIRADPGHFSEDDALVVDLGWSNMNAYPLAFGLSTDVDQPGTDGSQGKGVFFSMWDTHEHERHVEAAAGGWAETDTITLHGIDQTRVSAVMPYEWTTGDYSARLTRDGPATDHGRYYSLWITDQATNVETKVGSILFPDEFGDPAILATTKFSTRVILTGDEVTNIEAIPQLQISLNPPQVSGHSHPHTVGTAYSPVHQVITNSNVEYDPQQREIIITAGGDTQRTTADLQVLDLQAQ